MALHHELFYENEVDQTLQAEGKVPALSAIRTQWLSTVTNVLSEATLQIPTNDWKFDGGREGRHSEHMGYILSDLQYMQRAYPNMEW